MTFDRFPEDFDCQDQLDYTWRFRLRAGENIATAVFDQVDPTSTFVLSPSTITLGVHSIGVIAGQVWGVTQWVQPTTDGSFMAYIRCVITTDWSQPLPRIITRTMRLQITQL